MSERSTTKSGATKPPKPRRPAMGTAWQTRSVFIRDDLRTLYGMKGDSRRLDEYCEGKRGILPETMIRDLVQYAREQGMDKERMRSHVRGLGDDIIERVYAA